MSERTEIRSFTVCSRTEDIASIPADQIDAILVDIRHDTRGDAAGGVRSAFDASCGRPVIALGLDSDDCALLASVEAGAAGCVTCEQSIDDLVAIVRAAISGELACPPRIGRMIQTRLLELSQTRQETERLAQLSQREHHVLSLLSNRQSNKQIARELGLEISTIKNHVHNIIVKLNVRNRTEAAEVMRGAQ
ncbi:response regulator transcription factor [Paracoccus caeni]|uniref:Response regulator transcription factor n=1 Tax=Paracoccus caeni TaxID=657651 RepID=A0A934W027_9RHOB|nr:response regulator transcription factor [Paracoccus caeni]MBK4216480.1 response regulator transcription factor [Paracoccus caeni]